MAAAPDVPMPIRARRELTPAANASAEFAMIEMTPGLAQAIADCPNCQAGGTDAPERSTIDERWSANLRAVCAVLRSRYRTDTLAGVVTTAKGDGVDCASKEQPQG